MAASDKFRIFTPAFMHFQNRRDNSSPNTTHSASETRVSNHANCVTPTQTAQNSRAALSAI
jgi:hypothetical protein